LSYWPKILRASLNDEYVYHNADNTPYNPFIRHKIIHQFLFNYFGDNAGAYCTAAFAYRKPKLFFHRDRRDQLGRYRDIVSRHDHLDAFR